MKLTVNDVSVSLAFYPFLFTLCILLLFDADAHLVVFLLGLACGIFAAVVCSRFLSGIDRLDRLAEAIKKNPVRGMLGGLLCAVAGIYLGISSGGDAGEGSFFEISKPIGVIGVAVFVTTAAYGGAYIAAHAAEEKFGVAFKEALLKFLCALTSVTASTLILVFQLSVLDVSPLLLSWLPPLAFAFSLLFICGGRRHVQ